MKRSTVDVIIEIPKGSRNKYEYDHDLHIIRLDRMLFSSVQYPSDYGFIPDTLSQDSDPLDALVIVSAPTFPGCVIETYPVGVFSMKDENGIDDKIICVPKFDPQWNQVKSLNNLPYRFIEEITHFFSIYKGLDNSEVEILGWWGRETAYQVIEDSKVRYQDWKDGKYIRPKDLKKQQQKKEDNE